MTSFYNDVLDITKIKEILKRNFLPLFLIDKIAKLYLDKAHSNYNLPNAESEKKHVFTHFHTSEKIQSKFRKSCQKSVNISPKMLILTPKTF